MKSKLKSGLAIFNAALLVGATISICVKLTQPIVSSEVTEKSSSVKVSALSDEPSVDVEISTDKLPYYSMSDSDIQEFATLVALEGSIESYECQCAIASVVLNRMTTEHKSLQEVIYAENQFEPADMISSSSPTESTLRAVKQVLQDGPTIPEYVTFFRADFYFDWVDPYVNIDHTYFSYDPNLKERMEQDEV